MQNPFSVQSPEDIEAAEALRLFVDVFTDFYKIRDSGHSMLNGPRGCGKSMMFRFLEPDCQALNRNCKFQELPFFAVLVSIKNTQLNLTELQRLVDRHANILLNEHFMVMYVCSRVFLTLSKSELDDSADNLRAAVRFYDDFSARLRLCGWSESPAAPEATTLREFFDHLRSLCDRLYGEVINYVRRLSFSREDPSVYHGPLCGYLDFLYPLCSQLRSLAFMPTGPVYLLIDDADYLNLVQTTILNTWVSTRTSAGLSIKISTQLKYKTYRTVSGTLIDSPHDYSEVNISDLYTSSKGKYLGRVEEIVHKRLQLSGIEIPPRDFFPEDAEQEAEIREIENNLRSEWESSGTGFRASDDVVRYARPTFFAGLKGKRKAGSTYSYAGFEQLVHISSGLIRYFLEPAALMYSEEQARASGGDITRISPKVQNEVIRSSAEALMLTEFEKIFNDEQPVDLLEENESIAISVLEKKVKLSNLIRALGGLFHLKLISKDSERRVFSVAFSDEPSPDVLEMFKLGMQFGYFHRSTIGNKDGTGRTPLYVLTRRLAPYFNLDPNGFAGYLFVTSDRIREAITNPDRFLRRVKERGVSETFEVRQLELFE
ncbi:MAG TPA: hypothetical protein VN493_21135 [Thermoanaerobaculia bacterium]|nr:hypothetical protein [Thermoanaerobaculia bacterium]